jgi:hypothetical protein
MFWGSFFCCVPHPVNAGLYSAGEFPRACGQMIRLGSNNGSRSENGKSVAADYVANVCLGHRSCSFSLAKPLTKGI